MTAPNLFTRDDTFLGVCQGLGDDLRIPPDLLRVALALGLFWNPVAVVAIYLGLGMVVLLSRRVFPDRGALVAAPLLPEGVNDEAGEPARLAA